MHIYLPTNQSYYNIYVEAGIFGLTTLLAMFVYCLIAWALSGCFYEQNNVNGGSYG